MDKRTLDALRNLDLLPAVLLPIIVGYYGNRKLEAKSNKIWPLPGLTRPYGLTSNLNDYLFVCIPHTNCITKYDLNGTIVTQNSTCFQPSGIDIDIKESKIYCIDQKNLTILNFELEILSSWKLPEISERHSEVSRICKYDNQILYFSVFDIHQVFGCNPVNGSVIKKWGKVDGSSDKSGFSCPLGLAMDEKNAYICDNQNHRIQIINKATNEFIGQWGSTSCSMSFMIGNFTYPKSIYRDSSEDLFYIGDNVSLQVFTDEGKCLQRISESQFNSIFGICSLKDQIYITDRENYRIQVFRKE